MSAHLEVSSLHIEEGIAIFTHQHPASRNAMSDALRRDYMRMLEQLRANRQIRVLILQGSEGAFCSGGNIHEMAQRHADPQASSPMATRQRLDHSSSWLRQLLELDALLIASVDGAAAGAGFSLALHADFILCSARSRFRMSFPRVGAVADFGAHYLLPRMVGLSVARDLLLTGRSLTAAQARRLGLVHAVHPSEHLATATLAFARHLLEGPPEALALSKRLLNLSFDMNYGALSNLEALSQAVSMSTRYHQDCVQQFQAGQTLAYDWDRQEK